MIKIFSYCPFRKRRKLIRKTHISIPDIYDIIIKIKYLSNIKQIALSTNYK